MKPKARGEVRKISIPLNLRARHAMPLCNHPDFRLRWSHATQEQGRTRTRVDAARLLASRKLGLDGRVDALGGDRPLEGVVGETLKLGELGADLGIAGDDDAGTDLLPVLIGPERALGTCWRRRHRPRHGGDDDAVAVAHDRNLRVGSAGEGGVTTGSVLGYSTVMNDHDYASEGGADGIGGADEFGHIVGCILVTDDRRWGMLSSASGQSDLAP
jgi:hypothetical protein